MLTAEDTRGPGLVELDTLAVCAAEGSLTGAAERLGISRPAVAKRIRSLESVVGRPMLERSGRGVRLSFAGGAVLASARRILAEREVLLGVIADVRGERPTPIAGLRSLLGDIDDAALGATRPQARLAETERVLELVLRASSTAVAISDPETAIIHEVNDAFCRITGRSREELIGLRATDESQTWADLEVRAQLMDELRRSGTIETQRVGLRRPDGSVRMGDTSAHLISLAGRTHMLSTVDDVTVQFDLEVDQLAGLGAYRALAQLARLLLAGGGGECVGAVLAEIYGPSRLTSVLLWDRSAGVARAKAGQAPPADLASMTRVDLGRGDGVCRLARPGQGGEIAGWCVAVPGQGADLVLLAAEPPTQAAAAYYPEFLGDVAAMVSLSEQRAAPLARS